MSFTLHGIPASPGIAIGRVSLINTSTPEVAHRLIHDRHELNDEEERFLDAQQRVLNEFAVLKEHVTPERVTDLDVLVNLHDLLLKDSLLIDSVLAMIRERRCNAEWALVEQASIISDQFDKIEDEYLRQRKLDIHQVVQCLLKALAGSHIMMTLPQVSEVCNESTILVAEDVTPAEMLRLKPFCFRGFITAFGSSVSHSAIAARSLGVPAVVGVHHVYHLLKSGDFVIIDGELGVIVVNPSAQVYSQYRSLQIELEQKERCLNSVRNVSTKTLDAQTIRLFANIESPIYAELAYRSGADGIGLLRTEFLFINREELPSEIEQYQAYLSVLASMNGRCVTIRTVDFGADKRIAPNFSSVLYDAQASVLGLRAIRFCFAEPNLFLIQLRAILRASAHGDVRILIPMLTHESQINQTFSLINEAKRQCDKEGLEYNSNIQIGAMIEVPASALAFPLFLNRFDFFSIGTNDLIQYTLAVDRTNSAVAHLYDPMHPAIVHLIAQVIKQADAAKKPIILCGEMAGDARWTRLLLGLGLTKFSLHPRQLLSVKKEILRSNKREIEESVATLLSSFDQNTIRSVMDSLR